MAFINLGFAGLLGLTVLFPVLAWPFRLFRSNSVLPSNNLPRSIEIAIPARNEAAAIQETLRSIRHAIAFFTARATTPPGIRVVVAANDCTDATAALARTEESVEVEESKNAGGKWATLAALGSQTSAEWIIFVDAGTHWPEDFLSRFLSALSTHPNAVALAPAYRPLKAGALVSLLWAFERGLKRLEAAANGPVTVHGATICYKSAPLRNALARLSGTLWLNDDVVLPLTLRILHPEGAIVYPAGTVFDAGIRAAGLDTTRRRRLLIGNLQWIRELWLDCARRNPGAAIIALRRVFRIFWAYWLASLLLGAAVRWPATLWVLILVLGTWSACSGTFRQLLGAAALSFAAPYYLCLPKDRWRRSWS